MKTISIVFFHLVVVSAFAGGKKVCLPDGATTAIFSPTDKDAAGNERSLSQVSDPEGLCKWAGLLDFVMLTAKKTTAAAQTSVVDSRGSVVSVDNSAPVDSLYCRNPMCLRRSIPVNYSKKTRNADDSFTMEYPVFSNVTWTLLGDWELDNGKLHPRFVKNAMFLVASDYDGICRFYGLDTHVSHTTSLLPLVGTYIGVTMNSDGYLKVVEPVGGPEVISSITCR